MKPMLRGVVPPSQFVEAQGLQVHYRDEGPALGHVPHEEDPAATLREVKRFLADTPG